MHKMRCILLLFALALCLQSFTQVNIYNFTRLQYGAGSQNWNIQQDAKGNIYVANNEGLLVYNGAKWMLYPMPNQTIVRFICFGKDGKLYAGGQDEIGYYEADQNGKLTYTSLVDLLPKEDRQFADVWNICAWNNEVFFRSYSKIFRLHNQKITTYASDSKWDFLGLHQNNLLAFDRTRGLLMFKNNSWIEFVSLNKMPANLSITSIIPFKNQSLVTTANNGLFVLNNQALTPFTLSGNNIDNTQFFTTAKFINDSSILLGTYDNGLYEVTNTGAVTQLYDKKEGLNSNNIKCIFKDSQHNIWLGLEDGISYLDVNSAVKWLNPKIFNGAAGYAATLYDNNLYLALANGIYKMPLSEKGTFNIKQPVQKIANGLTWHLTNIENKLFTGRDDGFFSINSDKLTNVDNTIGYWLFKPLSNVGTTLLFAAGNYLGINIFSLTGSIFKQETNLNNLNISARFLEYDAALQAIWISHPYRGIYKIDLSNKAVSIYTAKQGLPSTLNNHVFKINNQILVATVAGIYTYNKSNNQFEPSASYNKIFANKSLRYLKEDNQGNLWFVHEKTVGVVKKNTQNIIYFPELQRRILSGFEHIFSVDDNHVLIGGEQGFFVIAFNEYLQNNSKPIAFIRNVTAKNIADSVLYGGFGNTQQKPLDVSYQWNAFHFEFSSWAKPNNNHLQYSYRLVGFEKEWSSWTDKTEKDYTNLPAGQYSFEVKARNNLNEESATAMYAFTILPPWYKTIYARIVYILLGLALFYWLYKLQEKRIHQRQEKKMQEQKRLHEEKQQLLAYEHQLQLEKSEKELMQLQNDKLESELASTAMNLVQKKEFLLRLKDEIAKLHKTGKENIDTIELKKILKSLTAEDKLDEEWDQFSLHFNRVHGNFLNNVKNKFPQLKAHELKLCAYLRMALSSKEIAQLMSISVRGVEISRYRLRKKLQVPPKEDLFQFLIQLDNGIHPTNNTDINSLTT